MTYKNLANSLVLLTGFGFVACGGSTTVNFVGDPKSTGGEGGDSTGGRDGDGGGHLGGLGGEGTGGHGTGGGIIVLGYCGDGTISAADDEVCDDGNERSGDGCSAACIVEPPFACFGEPSVCSTCGNGTHDDGEGCDDGNVVDGDGCSADCGVEGDCEEPILLEWEDDAPGVRSVTLDSSTAGGGNSSPSQVCSGLVLGDGSDRAYKIVVEEGDEERDLTITVEAEFDAILRIYGSQDGSVCDPEREAFCFDEDDAGGVETFHFRQMPPGAEIVFSVDGAEEGDEGDFTVTATYGCGLDHLKLHRMSPYRVKPDSSYQTYGQVSLKNTSEYCAINLSRANLYLTDFSTTGQTILPDQELAPLDVFRASIDVDPAINPNAFDLEGITLSYFDAYEMGAFLCDGSCDLTEGTNVFDGVSVGGAIVPPGVTFPTLPEGENSPYSAFVRVANNGVAPNFSGADWSPAFLVDPDDFTADGFVRYNDTGGDLPALVFDHDPSEGTVVSVPDTAGVLLYSTYGAALPPSVETATYVSYKVRTGNQSSSGCYTSFGINNGSLGTSTGWGDNFDLNLAYTLNGDPDIGWFFQPAGLAAGSMDVWHTVELENINWTDHTFDVRYDGVPLATAVSMNDTASTIMNLFSLMPYYPVDCHYSDIIVRNGPPGRIWESPPVLIAPD